MRRPLSTVVTLLLSLTVVPYLPACSETDSTNVKTSGLWAHLTIVQSGDGDVSAEAAVRVGGSTGTELNMVSGEHLEVNGATMTGYQNIFNQHWYAATIPPDPDGLYNIVFMRVDEQVSTTLTMPLAPYTNDGTTVHTDNQVTFFWDDPETGGDVQVTVDGSCIETQVLTVDSSAGELTTEPIADASMIPQDCPFAISISRHVQGDVNPAYQAGRTEATRHSSESMYFISTLQ